MAATATRPRPRAHDRSLRLDWRSPAVLVGLLTLAVLVLRLTQIRQSLYGDEIWTYGDVRGHGLGQMVHEVFTGPENSPPLFFVLAWLFAKLGHAQVAIRLPSLILGVATLPLLYALGRSVFDRRHGLLAAAILGVSPFSLYYGIEARTYATMAFFVVLSTWALLRSVRSGDWRWWLLYALAAAAAAYSHYTAVFALAVQGLWSLWAARARLRLPILANALVVALYLPWLGHIRGKALAVIAALHPLSPRVVISDFSTIIPGFPYTPPHVLPTLPVMALLGAVVLVGIVSWLRRLAAGTGARAARLPEWIGGPRALMVSMAAATPVGLLVYSLLSTDLWLPRGLYASVPYLCLLLAAAALAVPRRLTLAAVVVVLAALLFGTVKALTPRFQRTPWRPIAAYLDRAAAPSDPIVAQGLFAGPAISEMFDRPHHVFGASYDQWLHGARGTTTWFVAEDTLFAHLHRALPQAPPGFTQMARRHYDGLLPITVLGFRRG